MKDLKVLVTGGLGFIGSNIIRSLNDHGITKITILDDLSSENSGNLTGLKFREVVPIHRMASLGYYDIVFHMGADSGTDIGLAQALMNNYELTETVFKQFSQKDTRIVFASSGSVYGKYEGKAHEDQMPRPCNPYALSKFLTDMSLDMYPNVRSVRYSNVFGPNEYHKGNMASVMTQTIKSVRCGRKQVMFEGSESIYRDFIYVTDAAQMTVKLALADTVWNDYGTAHRIYNIGMGSRESFAQVIFATISALNLPEIHLNYIVNRPFPHALKERYQYHTEFDTERIFQATGHKTMNINSAIKQYVLGYYSKTRKLYIGEQFNVIKETPQGR